MNIDTLTIIALSLSFILLMVFNSFTKYVGWGYIIKCIVTITEVIIGYILLSLFMK